MHRDSSALSQRLAAVRTCQKSRYRLFNQIVGLLHELLPARLSIDVYLGAGDGRRLGDCTLEPSRLPVSPARGPPTAWGEFVQMHDDREAVQVSPDELPVIDIHSL